jgi:hypothetical protein
VASVALLAALVAELTVSFAELSALLFAAPPSADALEARLDASDVALETMEEAKDVALEMSDE